MTLLPTLPMGTGGFASPRIQARGDCRRGMLRALMQGGAC
ncbi:hypothetical protein GCM10022394_16560 [Zobellella aerophila]|uniref:Uncharacterized protein n=1 Tax=Zobellella aerophila TaxID=870480 RepID=A0ABP6VMW7_9GAMM